VTVDLSQSQPSETILLLSVSGHPFCTQHSPTRFLAMARAMYNINFVSDGGTNLFTHFAAIHCSSPRVRAFFYRFAKQASTSQLYTKSWRAFNRSCLSFNLFTESTSTSFASICLHCECRFPLSLASPIDASLFNSIVLPLIGGSFIYAFNDEFPIDFVDALFLAFSAQSVCGLTTADLSQLAPAQNAILFIHMLLGNPVGALILYEE